MSIILPSASQAVFSAPQRSFGLSAQRGCEDSRAGDKLRSRRTRPDSP